MSGRSAIMPQPARTAAKDPRPGVAWQAKMLKIVATCALGLEGLLEDELTALASGREAPTREKGAVSIGGDWADVWRANWRLRTANRVLVELGRWPGGDGDTLAGGAESLVTRGERSWGGVSAAELFQPHRTLAVHATSSASSVRDTRWVALKVKDGLVDGQRRRYGRRASVDRRDPDLALRVRLHRDEATLLLDTSGAPLDRRGYRVRTTAAPVREQIAAACVLASGWDGRGPVVDPMCGSGTLLAEAATVALGRAPGRLRDGWAFERLPGFDATVFRSIRDEPIPAPGPEVRLYGIDRSRDAVEAAAANLRRARLLDRARLVKGDGFAFEPPSGPGLVTVNPPYGERLEGTPEQWKRLGDLLKRRYGGWRAVVLAGGADRGKHIGLRPSFRLPVRNGPLEARILGFELY